MTKVTAKVANDFVGRVNGALVERGVRGRLCMYSSCGSYQLYEVLREDGFMPTRNLIHSGSARSIINGVNIWLTQNGHAYLRTADPYYDIVRFYRYRGRRTIRKGVSLEAAQDHCNDPATRGEDYFHGYVKG